MVLPKKKPVTTQELRKFGLQIGGIFLAIALFVLWRKGAGHKVFMVTGLLGVYLVGFGAALPDSLAGFHRFWLKLADLLGRYVGHYVGMAFFSLLYWILFAPVAVIMRIVGFDPLGYENTSMQAHIGIHARLRYLQITTKGNSVSRGKPMSKKSILTEYWEFLKYRKKFWLLPILVIMMGLGLVLYFAQTSTVAPFIYTLF
ncbi:MAG: hypothetical protein IPI28_17035 [Candidatus Omnitrophica bacterium]|nr:hypothetical protein [Candidatus Omnitrophota bacterium]